MGNNIYINYDNPYTDSSLFGLRDSVEAPLAEDPILEIQSSFQSISDIMPGFLQGIFNLMKAGRTLGGAGGGTANIGFEAFLDLPLWSKTEAVKLVTKLHFFPEGDPYTDVWLPTMGLASQAMLILNPDTGKWKVPGISMSTYKQLKAKSDAKKGGKIDANPSELKDGINLISIEIPGVIYLDNAVVLSAKPVFSKHVTSSGYPLWATLDLEIRSIYPANNKMFEKTTDPIKESGRAIARALAETKA